MAFTALFIALLMCSSKASANTLHDYVVFNVYPSEYIDGLTSNVDIHCSFHRESNYPIVSVMSILISFTNASDLYVPIYVASVNEREGYAHNISNDVSAISGAVDNNNGQSFLEVKLRNAHAFKDGVYKCEVAGFDEIGLPFTLTNTSRTQEVNPDLSEMFSKLVTLDTHLVTLRDIATDLQRKLNSAREAYFYSSTVYNGHRYYMAINIDHFIYSEAQALCKMHGGYLVELDSSEEQLFVRDFLQHVNANRNYSTVMTGATDEDQEGVWLNKHNRNSRPTFDWGPGSPTNNRDHNCQYFGNVNSIWYLHDASCYFYATYNKNSFICETPEDAELVSLT